MANKKQSFAAVKSSQSKSTARVQSKSSGGGRAVFVRSKGSHQYISLSLPNAQETLIKNTANVKEDLKSIDEIPSAICRRVIRRRVSAILGTAIKIKIQHDDAEQYESQVHEFMEKVSFYSEIENLLGLGYINKDGGAIYFADNNLPDTPLGMVEAVNVSSAKPYTITEKGIEELFSVEYKKKNIVVSTKVDGRNAKLVCDESRVGFVKFNYGEKSTYAKSIFSYCQVLEQYYNSLYRVADLSSVIVYEVDDKFFEAMQTDKKKQEQLQNTLKEMESSVALKRMALMPKVDKLTTLQLNSKDLVAMKDALNEQFCACVGVPVSIVFGSQQGGLNTGEGKSEDAISFMREVISVRSSHILPILDKFLKSVFVMIKLDPSTVYDVVFEASYEATEEERLQRENIKADIIKKKAEVAAIKNTMVNDFILQENVGYLEAVEKLEELGLLDF